MRAAILAICFWGLLGINSLFCQVAGTRTYLSADGYPAQVGYIIHQDSLGFIWIGTDRGAVRFDGQQFELFDEQFGLKDKEILQAVPGANRQVILTPLLNHWACFRDDQLQADEVLNLSDLSFSNTNSCIRDWESNTLWLSETQNTKASYRLDSEGLHVQHFQLDQPYTIEQAFGETLFLSLTPQVMGYYHLPTDQFTSFEFPDSIVNSSLAFVRVNWSRDHLVAYSSEMNSICVFALLNHTPTLKATIPVHQKVKQVRIDAYDQLWITYLEEGVDYFGPVTELRSDRSAIRLFDHAVINDAFADRDRNLWFTTQEHGLHFISKANWENHLVKHQLFLPKANRVSNVANFGGGIGISFKDQLMMGRIRNGKYEALSVKGLGEAEIKRLFAARNRLFFTQEDNIIELVSKEGAYQARRLNFGFDVKDLDCDSLVGGACFAATHDGLFKMVLNTDPVCVFNQRTSCVRVCTNGDLLIGTPSGLYIKERDKPAKPIDHPVLKTANISSIAAIAWKRYLISTTTQGMYVFDSERETLKSLKLPGEYPSALVRMVATENERLFWLATDQGAFRIGHNGNFEELKVTHFTQFNGLPSNEVKAVAVHRDTAFIATSAGLAVLSPNHEQHTPTSGKTVIYRLNEEDHHQFLPTGVTLAPGQNDLSLTLKHYSFAHPPFGYRFRLEGLDQSWYFSQDQNIRLTNLPPGEYTFKAVAVDHLKEPLGEEVSISVTVAPTFWQSLWVQGLSALGACIVLVLVTRFILLKNRAKALRKVELEKKLANLELEAIKAQINPHFIYNCLNSIQYFTHTQEYDKSLSYLEHFAVLVRQTMALSQQTFATVKEEFEYLSSYLVLEKMRFKERLDYQLIGWKETDHRKLLPAMMLQPFVENAIKHGISKNSKGGTLKVTCEQEKDNAIRILIDDNGPGWDDQKSIPNGKETHLGLRLGGSRADTYNHLFHLGIKVNTYQKSSLDSKESGTIVDILIPEISHETYSRNH